MPLARALLALIATLLAAIIPWTAAAQTPLPVPALTSRVIDETGTLGPADREALEARLAAIEARNGSQVAVLLVPTTQPEDIAAYANRVGNAWKIGRREVGDGVVVVVAVQDRRMRIEVAKSLEGALPDIATAHIIDETMKPRFRQNDYAGGLMAAVDQIGARIAGENLPLPAEKPRAEQKLFLNIGFLDLIQIILYTSLAVIVCGDIAHELLGGLVGGLLLGSLTGGLTFAVTSSLLLTGIVGGLTLFYTWRRAGKQGPLVSDSSDRGDRSGGSFSSGGSSWGDFGGGGSASDFSSGGGGDFGGGGASGDW